jgi:hypothetical protein
MVAACSGGNVTLPRANPGAPTTTAPSKAPTKAPTASPVPTVSPTVAPNSLSAAQVNVALQSTQTYFATLPHTSVVSDLQAVAKQMVSSGNYKSAVISPGGITGTLQDGTLALVFADVPEDVDPAAAAAARRARANAPVARRKPFAISAPNSHEYAFLYNDSDPDFREAFDNKWATAFVNVPFTGPAPLGANAQYGVSTGSLSLGDIVGLGSGGHPIDFLNLTTHGMVATASLAPGATSQYYLLSTTKINALNSTTYNADLLAKNVVYGMFLSTQSTGIPTNNLGLFAFTPGFLTSHLQFNPGAVVNLAACFGQSPTIQPAVAAVFQNAHIGRYYGWTKAVGINDDYQSMSFMFDRLIGEQSPSTNDPLATVADQRTPPQRPFGLDNVYGIMQSEMRSSVTQPAQPEPYTVSNVNFAPNASQPPLPDGTTAKYEVTDFGSEGAAGAPIVYAFPSISNLSIVESSTQGTMTIAGQFPPDTGTAQIVDASGITPLTVTNWSQTAVTATLAAGGNGSSGLVTVLSATGVPSNAVPLTKWLGELTYTENDTNIPDLDGTSGSGSGSLSAQFNIDFRADVHPVVPSIDSSPLPQTFAFDYTEGDSTAQLTSYTGSYTSSESSPHTATFSLASPVPILNAATPPLKDNTFEVRTWANQPAPCNAGMNTPGTVSTNTEIFCPLMGFVADPSQIICTDDDAGALCTDNGYAGLVSYGGPYDAMGLLSLVLDPSTYNVAVAGTMSEFTSAQFYDIDRPATASMSGTINAPSYAPTATTPASKSPHARPAVAHRRNLGQIGPDEAAAAAALRSRSRQSRSRLAPR